MKLLLLQLSLISLTKQVFLNNDVLLGLGFKPLGKPELIEKPLICKEILSKASTCVDLDDFLIFVDNF